MDVEELCRKYDSDSGHVALPIARCETSHEYDEDLHADYTVLPVLASEATQMGGGVHTMSTILCGSVALPMTTRSHGNEHAILLCTRNRRWRCTYQR